MKMGLLLVPAGLTYLLVVPNPLGQSAAVDFVRQMHWSGYLIHFLTYLVLGSTVLLIDHTWVGRRIACLAILTGHALLTEVVQAWVPTRSLDIWDAAANLGGIAGAWLACRAWEIGRRAATLGWHG